jgi:hypothetical protein
LSIYKINIPCANMTAPYMRNLGMCEELTLKNKGGRILQKQIDRSIGPNVSNLKIPEIDVT